MGAVAGRLSDLIVITSDNPRSEDPDAIIEEIQRGITAGHAARQRAAAAGDRRSARGDREGDRAGPARRSRADRRQGAREVPGDRRPRAAVRRRGGGARGAGAAADELGRRCRPRRGARDSADGRVGCRAPMAGTLVGGDAAREFAGVSIDTRTLAPGELYIAIRGERFDGAEFAAAAIARGRGGRRGAARRGGASATAGGASASSSRSTTRPSALQALAQRGSARSRARKWWRSPAARARPRRRK